ncbi:type II secretion system F family protein [Moraxella sp. ZJ142]|uniref:type II secretion system F family protein n=1 Tax=Moraxella marmotae TaxID=3344520 RepID=UPI0035D51667
MDNLSKSQNTAADTVFKYKALTAQGKTVHGQISAKNALLAKAQLRKQGLSEIVLSAKGVEWHIHRRIPARQILLTLRTLSTLVGSGIVLSTALGIAAKTTNHAKLATKIHQIKTDIEQGNSFGHAIAKHAEFDTLTVALINAGEQSGKLDTMLDRAARHAAHQAQLKAQLTRALRYPLLVAVVAVVVTAVLLLMVVPSFAATFENMGSKLPTITQWVLGLSNWLAAYFWTLLIAFGIGVAILAYLYKTSAAIRLWWASKSLSLPVFGQLITAVSSARFASTLATTLQAGVPLTKSIDLAGQAANQPIFIKASQAIALDVAAGISLADAMKNAQIFPAVSTQMVSIGEASGKLSEMLEQVAAYHNKQAAERTDALVAMIEPAIILTMGVLIGGLVLAMYLPIFNMGAGL